MVGGPIGDMDVEYARTVADRAMRSMWEHSVPATPGNFSVLSLDPHWAPVTGPNFKLKDLVSYALGQGPPLH